MLPAPYGQVSVTLLRSRSLTGWVVECGTTEVRREWSVYAGQDSGNHLAQSRRNPKHCAAQHAFFSDAPPDMLFKGRRAFSTDNFAIRPELRRLVEKYLGRSKDSATKRVAKPAVGHVTECFGKVTVSVIWLGSG